MTVSDDGPRPRTFARRVLASFTVLVFTVAASSCTAHEHVFQDRPDSDVMGALKGYRECGFSVQGRPVGHWLRYRIDKGRPVILGDDWYDAEGRISGLQTLMERNGLPWAIGSYERGEQHGFLRLVAQDGTLRTIGYWRDGVPEGWHYSFDNGRRELYADGQVVRVEDLDPTEEGFATMFSTPPGDR